MKKILTAIALTIAVPAMAHAQTTPAADPKAATAHTGHNMQDMNCKDMQGMKGHAGHQASAGTDRADHSKMDHSKMDRSKMAGCSDGNQAAATQAPANPHANHQR